MPLMNPAYPLGHVANPRVAARDAAYGERQRKVLNRDAHAIAAREITSWPGYERTPLHSLPALAAKAGVGRLWYKDESGRFGLGSFKALGGAYAVLRLLIGELARSGVAERATAADLVARRYADAVSGVTVTCATDGNHGRSVAWGAQQFGCRCVIYVHATVSEGRKKAIERYGARVVVVQGNYDDAVRQAARDAAANGWHVVSDTSYEGYVDVPRDVMQGYTVMAQEALDQLPATELPTHVFVQGGVGGVAAAVAGHFWETLGERRPRIIVVEPERAACIFESVRAGRLTSVHGDLDTVMAGLSCGEVSLLAWEILEEGIADVLAVPDEAAIDCMRLLANPVGDDPAIVAGESAVAGLAGLLLARERPSVADALELDRDSRVLLFGTEGATDPELYARLVGRSHLDVEAVA